MEWSDPPYVPCLVVDPAEGVLIDSGLELYAALDRLRAMPETRRVEVVRMSDGIPLANSWAQYEWGKSRRGRKGPVEVSPGNPPEPKGDNG